MPWLADSDVGARQDFARALADARTVAEVRNRTLAAMSQLVPADVMTWDRVELNSGAVWHTAFPADAEPPGAFDALVGDAAGHPLLAVHAARQRGALRLSEAIESGRLARSELFGELLRPSGFGYGMAIGVRTERREAVVAGLGRAEREFSERDRDLLDLVRPALEGAVRATQAREHLEQALAAGPPPGTAVVLLNRFAEIELSSFDAERWLAGHFGPADHPGWLPEPVDQWLALPPRPPLISEHDGRRLTIRLLPGDPHALLLEEQVTSFRADALDRLGLTARETEVLHAASALDSEVDIAWELFLSLHAVRDRLERLEAKLGVRTAADAIAHALREST